MYRSYRRSEEDEKKTKNVWLKGHTGKYNHTLHPVIIVLIQHIDRPREYDYSLESAGLSIADVVPRWEVALGQTYPECSG